ncbi:MAG: VWA domain-containing protein [bacterium]
MRFARPDLLIAAAATLVLLPFFFLWAFRSADRARRTLLADDLVPRLARGFHPGRRRVKAALQIAGVTALLLALAGPRAGSREVTVKRKGIDLVIALDVSNSMLARDIPPSRLDRARHEISAFLDGLKGDRVALVAFAGDAFLECPLTLDYGAARMFLDVMDTHSVSRQGTDIGAAIRTSLGAFGQGEDKYRAIVLVTDGEDQTGDGLRAAEEAARRGIKVYTIGVGSESGEPIPLPDDAGGGYKKDKGGQVIMTTLNPETLEKIALTSGGEFHRATTGELELEHIHESLQKLGEKELASRSFTQYEERFQFPLALGLLLLLIDFALPERVRADKDWEGRFA